MRDMSKNIYTQNGQSSLPIDQTDSLYPPNSANGFAKTRYPEQARSSGYIERVVTRMTTYTFFSGADLQLILGFNAQRNYIAIQNNGAATVFVGFGSQPDLGGNNAIQLPSARGLTFENGIVPNNDVYVISSVPCQITVIEGIML